MGSFEELLVSTFCRARTANTSACFILVRDGGVLHGLLPCPKTCLQCILNVAPRNWPNYTACYIVALSQRLQRSVRHASYIWRSEARCQARCEEGSIQKPQSCQQRRFMVSEEWVVHLARSQHHFCGEKLLLRFLRAAPGLQQPPIVSFAVDWVRTGGDGYLRLNRNIR